MHPRSSPTDGHAEARRRSIRWMSPTRLHLAALQATLELVLGAADPLRGELRQTTLPLRAQNSRRNQCGTRGWDAATGFRSHLVGL